MQIQVALDFMPLAEALHAALEVAEFVDRVECGTSLIFADGMKAVTALKQELPGKKIVADLKIVDHGEEEASIAYEAGADSVTVMSCASDETILGAVRAARRYRKEMIVELSMRCAPLTRAPKLGQLGADLLCVRIDSVPGGVDADPYAVLGEIASATPVPLAVAGSVSLASIAQVKRYSPAVVIVGHFFRSAPDRRSAAEQLRARVFGT